MNPAHVAITVASQAATAPEALSEKQILAQNGRICLQTGPFRQSHALPT
jgi:hypothetical protein